MSIENILEKVKKHILMERHLFLKLLRTNQETIISYYKEAATEIEKILTFYADDTGGVAYYRLTELLSNIKMAMKDLDNLTTNELSSGIKESAKKGALIYVGILGLSGKSLPHIDTISDLVQDKVIREVSAKVFDDGLQLSDRLWRVKNTAKTKVKEVIESSVIQGQSAKDSIMDFIKEGKQVPSDLIKKASLSDIRKIGRETRELLINKKKGVTYKNLRVARTEMARVHRTAYLEMGNQYDVKNTLGIVGHRWNLAPTHPKVDICDGFASHNEGLGSGGYKVGYYPGVPAHPNCMCYETPIFDFERKTV